MRKKRIGFALGAMLSALCFSTEAQQQTKVPRIGFLESGSPGSSPNREPFREGLRELGYVEGKNFVIEYRYANGKLDRFPDLVAEMVRIKVIS